MKKKVLNLREIIILIVINVFIFQTPLQESVAMFQYIDEVIAVIMGTYLIFYLLKQASYYYKYEVVCIVGALLVLIIGLIGNYTAKIQLSLNPIVMDIGNNFKFIVVYFGAMLFMRGIAHREYLINCLAFCTRIYVVIATICAIINFFVDINMSYDMRFGIRSFQFIYGHAGMLNIMCYMYLMILSADLINRKNKVGMRNRFIFIILVLFVWCCTLRTRAFVFALLYVIFTYIILKNIHLKIKFRYALPIIITCVLISYPQVEKYFLNDSAPRAILLKYGIVTMNSYFPLGSGFATYGSHAASEYYSRLYYQYGFDHGYGIRPNDRQFLADNYWPSLFAQYGVFGTVLMIFIFYNLLRSIYMRTKNNLYYKLAAMIGFFSLIISSFVTSSISHYTAVGIFFMIPLFFDYNKNNRD